MASLESHYGIYRIVFRFAGRKFSRSLKTGVERVALSKLARLEENLARVEEGDLLVPLGADPVTFLLSDGRRERPPKPKMSDCQTISDLFDRFLAALNPESIESTTEHCVRIHVKHLRRELGDRRRLSSVDFTALQEYIDARSKAPGLNGKKLSATTIKKEIATLGMIWNWAQNHEFVDRQLPKKGLRYPQTQDRPPFQTIAEIERKIAMGGLSEQQIAELWDSAFLTLPEIEQLLKHVRKRATHRFLFPMFLFAAHTGARRSEMRRSKLDDLDFAGKRIFLRERKRVRGRHTLRSVPMSPLLEKVMRDWIKEHPGGRSTFALPPGVVKSSKNRTEPTELTDDEAGHHFEQVLRGTKWAKLRGWHVFRHSFCSNAAAQGIDQRMINAWVGHQTEEMVRRYRHLIPNRERDAIRQVFPATNNPLVHAASAEAS